MGEWSAVKLKPGESVSESAPGLRRPIPPSPAGRKLTARLQDPSLSPAESRDGFPPRASSRTQRKTGRGAGQQSGIQSQSAEMDSFTENPRSDSISQGSLNDLQITTLIQFFQALDRWDRELHSSNTGAIEVNS